jgi:long-chain acyl-CoA synthetase
MLWTSTDHKIDSSRFARGDTLTAMFWNAVSIRGNQIWMRQKEFGIWEPWSWQQVGQLVGEVANGLLSLDVQPGQCAAILANTRVEWVWADMAILSCGGVTNGVYPTDSSEQLLYLCEDSRATVLFVEDEEQLDKALAVRKNLPQLRHIIVFDMKGLRDLDDAMVISLDRLRELGRAFGAQSPALLPARIAQCQPQDLAILVYTSGTTGKPKGAMHSHAGLVYSCARAAEGLPQDARDERMCFLPLCHIAERLLGAYAAIYTGTILNFVENPETVPENVREIAPTTLFAVPRVWEKFYSAVTIAIKESTPLQRLVYAWSIRVGGQIADLFLAGRTIPAGLKLRFILARWLALDNVRKMIGIRRARYLTTGAAPISPDLIRWYLSLGVPMLEGWAQTESCALGTMTQPQGIRPGTIGRALAGTEVRVDPGSGELLIRGPNVFMGYLNQPEKTRETIDADGWLHTGDVGAMDADGYFRITDRMKDIIITAGGKNITPSEFENELKFSPYLTDAVVIGDRRPYLVAIIMIDQENVERFAQDNDVPFSNYASLTSAPEVLALIQAEVSKVNKKFARVEQIKNFWLLDTQLSAEDEELTPTMKLKRKFVEAKYAQQIEKMYQN